MIKVIGQTERLRQGDIYRDVEFIETVEEECGELRISKIVYPLVMALTQDCDLEQDNKFRTHEQSTKDKILLSVLVVPLYNSEHVFLGEHLSDLDLNMMTIKKNKTHGELLRQNTNPRYHYLEFPISIPITPSIIDFKHFFSVSTQYLLNRREKAFVCSVSDLYREDISQRFSSFLSRIGLPE